MRRFHRLLAALFGLIGGLGGPAITTAERAVLPAERTDTGKQQRENDRLRRRLREPRRTGTGESARRRRQIADERLRPANGLQLVGG